MPLDLESSAAPVRMTKPIPVLGKPRSFRGADAHECARVRTECSSVGVVQVGLVGKGVAVP